MQARTVLRWREHCALQGFPQQSRNSFSMKAKRYQIMRRSRYSYSALAILSDSAAKHAQLPLSRRVDSHMATFPFHNRADIPTYCRHFMTASAARAHPYAFKREHGRFGYLKLTLVDSSLVRTDFRAFSLPKHLKEESYFACARYWVVRVRAMCTMVHIEGMLPT